VFRPKSPSVLIEDALTPVPTPEPTATPQPLLVYVSGAVHQPDVYELAPDSIVKDALVAAGGASGEADLDRINLARRLSDGEHVYVPHQGEGELPVEIPVRQPGTSGKVNINTAGRDELETLPRVGPVTAQSIIDHRETNGPFVRIEDIMDVMGIGPATFEGMKDLITTE
jgi:competence protein ComEA